MAELNTSAKNTGKKYSHKLIRVDLTPMVDLGFLLITFFILTTSMLQPHEMELMLPKDSKTETFLEESTSLTFILENKDSIAYYEGLQKKLNYASFGAMRNIIHEKQISLIKNYKNKNSLTLIFKPTDKSTYKNFVDALDEVTISDCRHYFFDKPGKDEIR